MRAFLISTVSVGAMAIASSAYAAEVNVNVDGGTVHNTVTNQQGGTSTTTNIDRDPA